MEITIQDIETRYGQKLSEQEALQVKAWLDDLLGIVETRVPDFADRLAEGNPSQAVVKAIFANAVIRVLRNPEGLRQHTESIDDYSVTKTIDSSSSAGLLYLTDDEWGLLLPATAGDAFTIRASGVTRRPGWWVHPDTWVPLP